MEAVAIGVGVLAIVVAVVIAVVQRRQQLADAATQGAEHAPLLAPESALEGWITGPVLVLGVLNPRGKYSYEIGCNVRNRGNKGVDAFRVTFYFSSGCRIAGVNTTFKASTGGPHRIDDSDWVAVEIIGPKMYPSDNLWVASVSIEAAPGDYAVRWFILSEDGRVPSEGYSESIHLGLPPAPELTLAPPSAGAFGPSSAPEIRSEAAQDEQRRVQHEAQMANDEPNLSVTAEVIDPEVYRRRGYSPTSNQWHLIVLADNAGPGVATEVHVLMNSGRFADVDVQIGPIGVGRDKTWMAPVDTDSAGIPSGSSVPSTITITYAGRGWSGGIVELAGGGAPVRYRVTRNDRPTRSA